MGRFMSVIELYCCCVIVMTSRCRLLRGWHDLDLRVVQSVYVENLRWIDVCQSARCTHSVWVRGPAQDFPLWTGLFCRPCIPVTMDCVYVGVYISCVCLGRGSVVRAPDSWLKGRGFKSLQELRENFLLQGRLSVLTLISVSVPPPCYRSST